MSNKSYNSGFAHQDWDKVVLRKETTKSQHTRKHVDPTVIKMAKLANTDDVSPIQMVSEEDKNKIILLRVEKKITQDELAKSLNLDKSVINKIERGTYQKDKQLTSRIIKHLNKCQTKTS
jgi:DNA-binding XRE family transcriptional regulator